MNEPRVLVDEVLRAQAEDPDFAVTIAKARAKARGENYDPEKHGPFAPPIAPGTALRFLEEAEAEKAARSPERAAELIDEWENRPKQLTLLEGQ